MNAREVNGRAVREAEGVNIVLGIWLMISPVVLGFSQNTAAMWNNILVGIALVGVELAAEWGRGALQALVVPLAAWLFASPFILGIHNASFLANNISMAFVIIAVGALRDGLREPQLHQGSPVV